jgi:hypothetical protein
LPEDDASPSEVRSTVSEVDGEVSEVRDAIPEIEAAETPRNDEGGVPTDDPTGSNDAFTDHEATRRSPRRRRRCSPGRGRLGAPRVP